MSPTRQRILRAAMVDAAARLDATPAELIVAAGAVAAHTIVAAIPPAERDATLARLTDGMAATVAAEDRRMAQGRAGVTIPEWLRRWLVRRLVWRVAARRAPDIVIGGHESPYLRRWYVLPRNRLFNVYLHHFMRSDDDRALHDHPWSSLSVILAGPGYVEVVPEGQPSDTTRTRHLQRGPGAVVFRPRARSAHRVQLLADDAGELPVWTLFLTGPRVREWGFWCPHGWRHWRDFTAGPRGETIGKGCE